MEEIERPEKRRKLDGDKEDDVLSAARRSPRVVIKNINPNRGVLERFQKKFAQERVITPSVPEETKDNNEVVPEFVKQNENTLIAVVHDNDQFKNNIKLWKGSNSKDDTVEVLDTSEQWITVNDSNERKDKRKRDDNSIENDDCFKVTKLDDEKCAVKTAESTSFSVAEATSIIKKIIDKGASTTMEAHTDAVRNTNTLKNQEIEDLSVSNIVNGDKIVMRSDKINNESLAINAQGKEVEVAKVAQNYAESGAQPEKKGNAKEHAAPLLSAGGKGDVNSNGTQNSNTEDALVYQLLKDVIEARTSYFENDLMIKNAKLEKRVEHLERENALLQRTSKRLHLALQEFFKNREKAQQHRISRGVQVNMNIRLSRTTYQNTSTINIDAPEQTIPTSGSSSIVPEKSRLQDGATNSSPSKSPTYSSVKIPRTKNCSCNDLRSMQNTPAKSAINIPKTKTDVQKETAAKEKNIHDSKKVSKAPEPQNVQSDAILKESPKTNKKEETEDVTITTIGIQTQAETTSTKKHTEGMGHFRLDPRRKYRNCTNQNSSPNGGETGHFRITPRGLEAQPKFSTSKTLFAMTESPQERNRDSMRTPKSAEPRIGKASHEQPSFSQKATDSTAQKTSSPSSAAVSEKIKTITQHSKKVDAVTKVQSQDQNPNVSYSGNTQSQTVTLFSSPSIASNERTNASQTYPQVSPVAVNSNNENVSALKDTTTCKSRMIYRPLSTSVANDQSTRSKNPEHSNQLTPKHNTPASRQQIAQQSISSKEASIQSKEAESEIIIVSPTERHPSKSSRPSEKCEQRETSNRVVQDMSSNGKQIVHKELDQSGKQFAITSAESIGRGIPQHADRSMAQKQTSNGNNTSPQHADGSMAQKQTSNVNITSPSYRNRTLQDTYVREKGQSPITPSSNAKLHQTSHQTIKNPNRVMHAQEQPGGTVMETPKNDAPNSRYASETRDPVHRGPGYPPQMISSQGPRVQGQIQSQRPAPYDVRGHPHPGLQSHQQQVVSNPQLPRLPVAIFDVRTQHPSAHPMPQQQHIVVRQHRPQQHPQHPSGTFQQQHVRPPQYTQRHPINPQQANIPRPQSQTYFQTHPQRQQATIPVGTHNIPRHLDPNNPRSPEFTQIHASRPQHHNSNAVMPPHIIPGNMSQPRHQGPALVYQPGTLEGVCARPNSQAPVRNYERIPPGSDSIVQQTSQHRAPLPGPPQQTHQINSNVPSRNPNQTDPRNPQRNSERRPLAVPERTQNVQATPPVPAFTSPPKPSASIAVVENGIVLSWNISPEQNTANIDSYELFACQDDSNSSMPPILWKKIGVVKALPLPMACTLTQFSTGSRYQFAVRAVDTLERAGPFSDPCVITLKQP